MTHLDTLDRIESIDRTKDAEGGSNREEPVVVDDSEDHRKSLL
jgi:hypothetical protein